LFFPEISERTFFQLPRVGFNDNEGIRILRMRTDSTDRSAGGESTTLNEPRLFSELHTGGVPEPERGPTEAVPKNPGS
jgi:hypothetical protein